MQQTAATNLPQVSEKMRERSALSSFSRTVRLWTYASFLRLGFAAMNAFKPMKKFPHSRELSVPSTNGKHQIKVQIYDPPTSSTSGPKPVHITWHGSGYVIPFLGADSRFCEQMAREAGCIVVDADYRKAPEYPFPAPYEDAMSVVQWVMSNPDGQFDLSRMSIGGFSAGGNFAAGAVGSLPPDTFKAAILLYPSLDFTIPPRYRTTRRIFFLESYQGDYPDLADPRLSSLFADPAKFPDNGRTFIVQCEHDWLGQDAEALKNRLESAGREPVFCFLEGLGHSWDTVAEDGTLPAQKRDEVYGQVAEVLKAAYSEKE